MRIAYWLIPASPYLDELQDKVTELASELNGPSFVPHITIYSGVYSELDSVENVLEKLSKFKSLSLLCKGPEFGDTVKRSCTLEFELDPKLITLNETVKSLYHTPDARPVLAHVSLFYGKLAIEAQEKIRGELRLPKLVKFDQIVAVSNQEQVLVPNDIESAGEVDRCRFS